tara:strand:+ start:2802 stop:3050 length:249 start_codon:yes stop_codon:yes gene_type:complete
MGRAIQMENDLESLMRRVSKLESSLELILDSIGTIDKEITQLEKEKEKTSVKTKKKEANDKGNDNSSKSTNRRPAHNKAKAS